MLDSSRITRIAIAVFIITVITGPFYTVADYSHITNLISELGAQQTKNNFVMIAGFLALGLGIMIDSSKIKYFPIVPFALFGFFMAMAGIFPHKPVDPSIAYNHTSHSLHSLSATLAGISISTALIWQGFLAPARRQKAICFYLAISCFVFPMLMLTLPSYQGLLQRIMYLQIFAWLWIMFPAKTIASKSL